MRIFYLSSEVFPFSKTGGLAEVAGSLPQSLKSFGHDIRIFTPRYKNTQKNHLQNVPVYFFEHEKYFGSRTELYQNKGKDYPDNLERFVAFCQAAIKLLREGNWRPDIIHGNDWQTALALAYLKGLYADDPFFKRTASVYTVHNLGYLGLFPKDKLPLTDLGWDQFQSGKLEFHDQLAVAKAGLVYADVINTVSETYAQEIQTASFGQGLEGLLQLRAPDLYGIINGIDYDIWNPATDQTLPKRYSPATLSLKVKNKIELQRQNHLPKGENIPVIGMINRLTEQKGVDLLIEKIDELLELNCQLVILGVGDRKYHDILIRAKQRYPEKIGVNLEFNAISDHLIYAGSDMFLMPSKYEPCGLGQLVSFKYGTVPIVRKTGGLADTVHDYDPASGEGDGFVFDNYESSDLMRAIKKALEIYKQKAIWGKLQKKGMGHDYSWNNSAKKYVSLYMKALAKIGIKPL